MWPPHERQSARAAIEELMRERGLARTFDEAAANEARGARADGSERATRELRAGRRRDLRDLPTFTIDPSSARDFDDAVSAQRSLSPDGSDQVRVWVHIADVSAYVRPGTLLDAEARRRGTSVYVPGAVEPMLPEALSNDACSLVPEVERATITVELDLAGAEVRRVDFYRSLIRSDARLDYERVDRIFAGHEHAEEPWAASLAAARAAAAALGAARERAGGLVLDTEEPEFVFDVDGHVREIRARVQTESHKLIEHLMIAANEAVARLLAERGAPCLYRVHERPESERVRRLIEQLASLGVPTPPVPDDGALSSTQAAELMGEVSRRVERHLRAASKRRDAGPWGGRIALTSLVLRTLPQAYYSPQNIGHSGLHSSCYCHFTSPIRRYPDLVCHRALLSAIGAAAGDGDSGDPGTDARPPHAGDIGELGEHCSARERDAMAIERDADDLARCFALERVLYEDGFEQTFIGEVTGLISAGAFVAFGGPGRPSGPPGSPGPRTPGLSGSTGGPLYEGMLPVRHLSDAAGGRDWWELNELGTILHGERSGATLRLGDPIAVQVARVDTARGRVDLIPAAPAAADGPGRQRSGR